ncbi:MAG TPA: hypothetical protein DEB39_03350 [Planctomycetaceae bacterium]|nr:hypothetical protein [Planctomycetaceae bacterium]
MACHGGVETPIDTTNNGTFFLNSRLRSRDIEKGTSHTIFLGEGVTINSYLARGGSAPSGGAYSGLGWMSGTPGTIRNTGSPINQTFPTAVWPLPFRDGVKQIDGYPWSTNVYADSDVDTGEAASDKASDKVSGKVSGKDTGKASDKAAEKAAEAAAVQKQLDALWGTVIPEQYYVGGYGSVHPQVSNFLFGDGSARPLNQMIDPVVYSDLGRRHGVAP